MREQRTPGGRPVSRHGFIDPSRWRRWAARLRRWVDRPAATFVHYPFPIGAWGPYADPRRYERIRAYLCSEGWLGPRDLHVPRSATVEELTLVHEESYLTSLQERAAVERVVPHLPAGAHQQVIAWQRFMVGGTSMATTLALRMGKGGHPVVHLGGGLHHAYAGHGDGFCLFNDVAVAIRQARQRGFEGRVLVVDLDLHQGNGTRSIFAADDTVFTLSIHARNLDDRPAVANQDVELGLVVDDRTYLDAIEGSLGDAFDRAQPELVMYVAGVDVAIDDQLGEWHVGADAIVQRDRMVLERSRGIPLVWVLAGGYGPNAWRHSARSLFGLMSGRDRPTPSDVERQLEQFRTIRRDLHPAQLRSGQAGGEKIAADDNFGITEADVFGDLGTTPSDNRLLGYYTPFGIEVALERYGVMAKLRRLGYGHVRVEIDAQHDSGQLVRVRSDDARADLLVELVARESREVVPWRLLAIEWLLLQNPRAQPAKGRPLLPGQSHPGLGCLPEVVGMLAMTCERLGYDGIAYHPAYYHMAALAKPHMAFYFPQDRARFLAMWAALGDVALAGATHLVADGRIRQRTTGEPVKWEPGLMVMPVSAALRDAMSHEGRAREVKQALSKWSLEVSPDGDAESEEASANGG